MSQKFYITTPIYYVNDQPHLGHSYTTLVADILARYYRRKLGDDKVFLLGGTDEHGRKIEEKAEAEGVPVETYVDQVAEKFQKTWQALNIQLNDFIRTTEDRHQGAVTKIMGKLRAAQTPAGRDVLYKGSYEGLYCVGCEKFLTDKDLVDGKCPLHNREPELIKEENWFFRLTDFLPQIAKAINEGQLEIYPEARKNETLGLIKQGLTDFSASRQSVKWGIPMSWDSQQTIYVWFEALMNYITAIGFGSDEKKFNQWWPADVQLMGLEILKFHAIYWPAMLMALKLPLPKKLLIHGFFTIDGQKMSKSLGNVIDPNELVTKYGSDGARYLILSQFSFGSESDIKVSDFDERFNADLANGLGNLVARVTTLAEKYLQPGDNPLGFQPLPLAKGEEDPTQKVWQLIEEFKFKEALNIIWELISYCDSQIEQIKPWDLAKTDLPKVQEFLTEMLARIKVIGELVEPFMPETAQKIALIFSADKITKPENLFNRIT